MCNLFHNVVRINTRAQATIKTNYIHTLLQKLLITFSVNTIELRFTIRESGTGKILLIKKDSRTHCKRMKQALVRLPNERPECNDIKLGDCLRLLHTHRGRTIDQDS